MASTLNKGMETKFVGGYVIECKQETRQDSEGREIPVGIIKGYIATWGIDLYDDKFIPGAFANTITDLKARGKANIPLKDSHKETIGGFPVELLKEDSIGLFGEAEINLEMEQGRDAYSLARQKVYDSFSVGYLSKEVEFVQGTREIKEAKLFEGTLTDMPVNEGAILTEVKAVTSFKDLPLADRERPWDAHAAKARVREWAGAEDGLETAEIQRKYRDCFFWYDAESQELFASYKLPFTDIIDGALTAIPRGVFAAAAAMQGARGGVDIPEGDRAGVERHIERYYDKMGLESPFSEERSFRVDDGRVRLRVWYDG